MLNLLQCSQRITHSAWLERFHSNANVVSVVLGVPVYRAKPQKIEADIISLPMSRNSYSMSWLSYFVFF